MNVGWSFTGKPLTVICPIQLRKLSGDGATRRLEIAKSSLLGSAADVLEESWLLGSWLLASARGTRSIYCRVKIASMYVFSIAGKTSAINMDARRCF